MAGSLNKATIIGNLGKDPEIRSLGNGKKVANLTVATSERWTDKASGEKKELTEWHRVSVFNEQNVDVIEKYLTKGASIYLEGKIQTRKYTDSSGAERYTTEIVVDGFSGKLIMLGKKDDAGGGERQAPQRDSTRTSGKPAGWDRKPSSDLDDEIPF